MIQLTHTQPTGADCDVMRQRLTLLVSVLLIKEWWSFAGDLVAR